MSRIHRHKSERSLTPFPFARRQAPIGDDNYLHLAGAAGSVEGGPLVWRAWREAAAVDLDGAALPPAAAPDLASSCESLKLARHADERSSGKSTRSAGSGYLTMSCLKQEPSEDSDASAERPARPPKPARLSPPRAAPLCEYVDVEPRPPERRTRPEPAPPPAEPARRCREYELMADFMSHARGVGEDAPPAVPPRAHSARPRAPPPPATAPAPPVERPASAADSASNDDSLLDELQRDYCVLRVCEDDPPAADPPPVEPVDRRARDDCGAFSRVSAQRKSNPIKTQPTAARPLKTSSSTSNVQEAAASAPRPLAERLTPFFLKKKPKPPEDPAGGRGSRKEENLMGRLTPRFGQSRLYGRGQSLELAPPEGRTRRIERSATTVHIPTRPMNSSIVANLKFLSLHRYGAQEDVQCRAFVRTPEEGAPREAGEGAAPAEALDAAAWRRPHAPSLLAASSDIRL